MDSFEKAELSLYNSVNTATPSEDVHSFDETDAPYVQNTGIERDGGITNIYEKETTYVDTGAHFITEDGKVITAIPNGVNRTLKIDDKIVADVSAYGVQSRIQINGVDDCIVTADDSYVTAVVNGSNVILTEYRISDNAQLNQRTITFTSLGAVTQFVTSLSIVRYNSMHYVDSFEFALRLGDQVVILRESTPGQSIAQALQSSSVLGTNQINDVIVYGSFLVVAGNGGRVGSFDGANWKNYDGSGTGVGPFDNGTAIGTNNILKLAVFNNYLIVGGAGGRIGSFDGNIWYPYTTAGNGFWNNSTVISTDNVTAMSVIDIAGTGKVLFVGGSAGKLGYTLGAAWTNYNGGGLADNATLIGAVQINAIALYTDYEGYQTIMVAGASGRVGSFKWQSGINYSFATTTAPGGIWQDVTYGNGIFVAVAATKSLTAGIATSPDGINWTFRTLPSAPAASWIKVTYGSGLFIALASSTSTTASVATSTDGINWTFQTLPSPPAAAWAALTYGNGLFVAAALTTSTTAGIATSPDGITWTFRATTAPGGYGWRALTYGNGLFVAASLTTSTTAGIATSPDGITWTFRTTTAPGTYGWIAITYGNGLFVAVANTNSTTAGIATSPDGITWTFRTTTAPGNNWIAATYGNGLFVITSNTTSTTAGIATSPDGITWTFRTTTAPAVAWGQAAFGNGIFVVLSQSNSTTAGIAYSLPNTNTKAVYTATTTQRYPTNNATVVSTDNILSATIWGRRMVVTGSAGKVGELDLKGSWTNYNVPGISQIESTFGNFPIRVAEGNGVLVGVGDTGTVLLLSVDAGNTWSKVGTSAAWKDVVFGNGVFIAIVGTSSATNSIATSTNGTSWTFQTLPNSAAGILRRIAYGNGTFVVVATNNPGSTTNSIATSSDNGVTWVFRSTLTAPVVGWSGVAYGGGKFVIISDTYTTTCYTAVSTDNGATWTVTTQTLGGSVGFIDITYGAGVFVATRSSYTATGTAFSSTDGAAWTTRTLVPPASGSTPSVVFLVDRFILVWSSLYANAINTSSDGITWSAKSLVESVPPYLNAQIAVSSTTAFIALAGGAGGHGTRWILPVTNNATVIGANSINASAVFNNSLVVGGGTGLVGSFDGLQWKNYGGTGTGTGPYNNQTVVGANTITSMAVYNTKLAIGANTSILGTFNADNSANTFYNASGTVVANLLTGQTTNAYLYVYRYENGYYLVNLVGNSLSKSYTLNDSTKAITILNAAYAIPQVKNNVTRHITTTFLPDYTTVATQIRATGYVGYTDFITWTGTQAWPNAPYTLGNGNVLSCNCGPGYQDTTFRTTASATNIYEYYSPQFVIQPQNFYNVVQSNTNTLINAYGKLNNQVGALSSKPFEFRVGLIPTAAGTGGQLSYLSCALLDTKTLDILGVLLTNVGKYDGTYLPMISTSEDTITYKYNNSFFLVKIGTTPTDIIQSIGGTAYKINTLSPLNILDTATASLSVGSSDYNGRMLFSSTVAPGTSSKIASVQYSKYSNSIDVGDKLVTINPIANTNYEIIGYRIPNVTTISSYAIDTYVNDLYYSSTFNDSSELQDVSKANLIYVNTPTTPKIVPVAIGQTYGYQSILSETSTIFLEQNNPVNSVPYDGYRIGNEIVGSYSLFSLNNGVRYLFDGVSIYSVSVGTGGYISNKSFIAPATGLMFVALAPTTAYFVSSFDNSLWMFQGGQSLVKYKRMNQVGTIMNGIYNVHDNALLLQTANDLIWIRDDVLTINAKKAAQTNLKLYSTTSGVLLGNDLQNWQYSFFNQGGATVVPLKWQSAYFGRTVNQKSILSEVVYTIYDKTKARHAITGYVYTRDPDTSTVQRVDWDVLPNMYTDGGYVTLRIKPETPKSLGTSFGLECNDKITILDAVMMFTNDVNAVVDQKRSR